MSDVKIYTDGGCIGNPGPGGWGAIIERGGHYRELGGAEALTTNNRMEMTAAIRGLEAGLALAGPGERVVVVTDSRYLLDGATKWIHGWKRKGWRKADGDEVLNVDLWHELDALLSSRRVEWVHVRGHRGHPENERCDEIANGFARGVKVELKSGDGAWIREAANAGDARKAKGAAKTKSTGKPEPKGKARSPKSAAGKKPAKPRAQELDLGEEGKYEKPLYLSMVDGDVREHATWAECEARVRGVKKSRHKKVKSRREHIETLAAWSEFA